MVEKGNRRIIDAVTSQLEDDFVAEDAVRTLVSIVEKGDQCFIAAMCDRLQRRSIRASRTRWAAVRTLRHIAEKGNHEAVVALTALLEDGCDSGHSRREALKALAIVAEVEDERVIVAVSTQLKDKDTDVSDVAVQTA